MSTQGVTWRADLHARLARRYALEARVTRAAIAMLALSLLGAFLGLGSAAHAALLVLGAAIGSALPVRPPLPRAFDWIGREAGLAYQTHVEHAGREDPFGLLSEAATQARLSVRGVAAPPRSTWWLPIAASAVGVWLVTAAVGGLDLFPRSVPGGDGQPPQQPLATPASEPDAGEATDADQEDERADDAGATTPPRDEGDGGDATEPAGGEGAEGEALERFLDNLRERPTTDDAEAEAAAPREAQRDPAGEGRDGATQEGTIEEEVDLEGALRPAPGEGDDELGEEEREERGGPGDGRGDGERAEEGDEGEPGGAGEGDEGDEGEGAEPGEGEPGAEGETAAGEGDDAAGPSGDETGLDAGEGDDAGTGRGAPAEDETTELESAGDPEALPGTLLPGEETPGGRVRLPGRDEGHLPEGASVERYERSVEQAITDGTVPVPYQEIIRNYFR